MVKSNLIIIFCCEVWFLFYVDKSSGDIDARSIGSSSWSHGVSEKESLGGPFAASVVANVGHDGPASVSYSRSISRGSSCGSESNQSQKKVGMGRDSNHKNL